MRKKEKKQPTRRSKIIKTVISLILIAVMVAAIVAANTLLTDNNRMVNAMMGANDSVIDNSGVDTKGLDLDYNKSDYSEDEIGAAEDALADQIADEGIVLLKNEDNALPLSKDTPISFFSRNSVTVTTHAGIMGHGSGSLKEDFEADGYTVNKTLWKFYDKGDGSSYGLGTGSISFGDEEDFAINECPLEKITADNKVVDSLSGTTAVYVLKRVAGEGRDMPRSMYNHTDKAEDQTKSYLEPDSVELEILSYLNDNFDNVVLVVNSNAALELDWVNDYANIKSIVLAPSGLSSLPEILSGEVNPSGRTVDTFAADALASPAAQNFGDYQYYDENGDATKYNYVSYEEGVYVGYRYYETRYEDVVLGQGNAGDYDYASEVCYPFGYGLSYTSFSYSELNVSEVYSGGKIQIRFKIKNIGKVSGAEIAQLYVCPNESDVIRSHIELKGFQKIYLHPGEEKEVILELDERSFSVYDVEKKAFSMLSGKYQICIGASVHDLQLKANIEVVGNSYFRNERELFPDYFREQPHGMEISAEQFYQLLGGEPKHDKEKKRGEYTVYDSYQDVVNVSMFGKFVRGIVHIGLKIMLRGKSERDPAFKMVKMGVEEGNLEGLIATSGGIATPKLIDMLVYNANKKYLQAFKRLLKK